eukprot:402345-Amphidinium_carterae.2
MSWQGPLWFRDGNHAPRWAQARASASAISASVLKLSDCGVRPMMQGFDPLAQSENKMEWDVMEGFDCPDIDNVAQVYITTTPSSHEV